MAENSDPVAKLEALQQQQLEPAPDKPDLYKPNKRRRMIRRKVYERYYLLRDDPRRAEAEAEWELADKEYAMYFDPPDPNDWRAHLHLPDAFSAIQTQAQETIERKSRPSLVSTEESDEPIEEFGNTILNYNMNNTGYDYQYYLGKLSAAIRGTAFFMDYWRTDKRVVKDPESVDNEGKITYKDKEIVDFDDDYTEWVPNEFIYIDEKAKHIDEANDGFRRQILNIDDFHRIYGDKPGFFDTHRVYKGGETTTRSFFKLPKDTSEEDVEILHYYNRGIDAYWCVANNVVIYDGPLPSKHKELPFAVLYQYRMPGQFWGIGIPKIIHYISEERRSIRMLNLDRQKIIVSGAFLHNSAFDIDDEETGIEPGRFISVDTNGQPIQQAIQQVNMGDVSPSYFRTEEILLEDERRATGIDDRIVASNAGTTATQAAIVKESSLKRINLISIAAEMDTVVRIGRLKWANIQFFYGTPRIKRIAEDNEVREEKEYRKISLRGRKFSVVDADGKKQLKMEDIKGNSALSIDKNMAKYIETSFDVTVDADVFTPISKAIEQTKKTEMFSLMLSNPATMALMDLNGASADVLTVNNIKPDRWLRNADNNKKDMMMLAESENLVMSAGQPLNGTDGATEDHTLVHLMYTETPDFVNLDPAIQQIIMDHILQEHDNNPATGSAVDAMGGFGMGTGVPGELPPPGAGGLPLPPPGLQAETSEPQSQVADLQPTNFANPE